VAKMILKNAFTLMPHGAVEKRHVVIEDDKIIDLPGHASPLPRDAETVDLTGHTIIPGLVNAHTHVAMSFFRGLGHGKANVIENFLFPAEKNLTPELLQPLSYSYIVAGLKSGATTFADHYYMSDGIARAFEKIGVRAVIGETIADLSGAFPSRDCWDEEKKRIENWNYSSLITPVVAPHAADTVSFELMQDMAKFAKSNKLPIHMHLSQTAGERKRVQKRFKKSPVEIAHKAGLLSKRTLAVHAITADAKDAAILKKSGATIGFCPSSQIIYEHLSPMEAFLKKDIPLAIGTDCSACNDGGDVMAELRLTALLARDRLGKPESVKKLYAMSGSNALNAFSLQNKVGKIAEGYLADLVILENDLSVLPSYDFLTNLIYSYSARQVRHVLVNGKWVLFDGKLQSISEKTLQYDYEDAVKEIQRRVKFKVIEL